jgi:hypothetical protein
MNLSSSSEPGAVRALLTTLTNMAAAAGLTLEQAADFMDVLIAIQKDQKPKPPPSVTPISKTVQ